VEGLGYKGELRGCGWLWVGFLGLLIDMHVLVSLFFYVVF
jgi:hypothetical protein